MMRMTLAALPRRSVRILATTIVLTLAVLTLVACGGGAPAAPTAKPAASGAAAPAPAPTKAAAAPAPTEVAAPKVEYPVKGRAIQLIVPVAAGGASDIACRVMGPILEKELGTAVQIVNKPGAGNQTGMTEVAQAKPDGYVVGSAHIPTITTIYLDPERKAAFTRESFAPVALYVVDPMFLGVKADSPYKSLKDLVDAAKAKPEGIKISTAIGKLGPPHLGILQLEKAAGTKFAIMLTEGGAQGATALLGGHVDAFVGPGGNFAGPVKSGTMRVLGVMASEESRFFPGVKTFSAQGYDVNMSVYFSVVLPKGAEKGVVDVLTTAAKKAIESPELKEKMDGAAMQARYLGPEDFAKLWAGIDEQVKPLMALAKD